MISVITTRPSDSLAGGCEMPMAISPERLFYIMVKAREFDAKVAPSDDAPGSNPTDDHDVEILEDHPDDPTFEELVGALVALNDDEKADVLALVRLGCGDYEADQWDEALLDAYESMDGCVIAELIGMPQLADFLQEGLAMLGISCQRYELNRL